MQSFASRRCRLEPRARVRARTADKNCRGKNFLADVRRMRLNSLFTLMRTIARSF